MAPETGVMAAWKEPELVAPKVGIALGANELPALSAFAPGTAVQIIDHEGEMQASVLESFVRLGAVVDAGERWPRGCFVAIVRNYAGRDRILRRVGTPSPRAFARSFLSGPTLPRLYPLVRDFSSSYTPTKR